MNNKKQEKKPTAAQMEKRLKNAVIHVDRTKDTKEIFFDDKGLRLVVNEDYAVVATGYHRHVFAPFTAGGISRPYMYIKQFVDIAKENDCTVTDRNGNATGYSYAKLFEALKAKDDKTEYNIAMYCDWYFFNIFSPLYSIGEEAASQFLTYFHYLHNIACQSVFLEEHKDGLTNVQFVEKYNALMKEFVENIEENQIFTPISDEQRMEQEIAAIQEQEVDDNLKQEGDGKEGK